MPDAGTTGWGLIAGNGRFPFLVLEGARSQGIEMAVIALKEEASEQLADAVKRLHWVSLGELSKAIDRMDKGSSTREQQFIRQVFQAQSRKLLESLVRPNTVRRNWGLVSRYETQVADTKVIVLGLGGRFIPLQGVEEATLKIGRMAF